MNTNPCSNCVWMLLLIGVLCFSAGYLIGQDSVQDANSLLSVGYTIKDPEGFEIREFDGPITNILWRVRTLLSE